MGTNKSRNAGPSGTNKSRGYFGTGDKAWDDTTTDWDSRTEDWIPNAPPGGTNIGTNKSRN